MASDRRRNRQYQILLLLRSKELVSAAEIADRFDVNVRTIYRDIEDLLQNQVPIQGTPGPEGGYRLRPEAAIDPTIFDSEDAFNLYLGHALQADERGAATAKAIAQSDGEFAELARAMLDRKVYFDPHDTYWRDEGSGLVPEVRRALLASEAISARWSTSGIQRHRKGHREVVAPLGLVWKAGHWYLVARDIEGEVFRERLANLSGVETTGLTFVAPDDFDLESWWTHEMEVYGKGDIRVVFSALPSAANDIRRLNRKKESSLEELESGGVRLTLFTDSWHWLVPLLAVYGAEVQVEEPDDLRAELASFFREAAAAYDSPPRAAGEEDTGRRPRSDERIRPTRGRPA